jgi:fructose-1,6-bisphosphatase/inositol monophosphatase family enzyme
METAATSKPPQRRHERSLRRVGSVLFWSAVVVLGAFGMYFSFANYPWFGAAVVLLILLLIGYSERKRRATRRAAETTRRRNRPTY